MQARLDRICRVISKAFDAIEEELFGSAEHHSMRLAVLSIHAGRQLGMDDECLTGLAISALFHDCALVEYYRSEHAENQSTQAIAFNMREHCSKGKGIVDDLPLTCTAGDFVLYHHECADGSGPFGKKLGEFPPEAELLSCIDFVDVTWNLQTLPIDRIALVKEKLLKQRGKRFSASTVDAFLAIFDEAVLLSLRESCINQTIEECIPPAFIDLTDPAVILLADVNAAAIDYKSAFTRKHTTQIANRTSLMCDYYGYDAVAKGLMFLAAGLHDLGKAKTPVAILEKPGKLTPEEFAIIKKHVYYTYIWLKDVPGFEDICRWASGHHEKLDGSGYPLGLCAEDIDFNMRLLGCIDIYQAVSEARPYHDARSHEATMEIMYRMANEGKIDSAITQDIDKIMAPWSMKDVPGPLVHPE